MKGQMYESTQMSYLEQFSEKESRTVAPRGWEHRGEWGVTV